MRALALANVRYWPTVAPLVQRELRRWEQWAREVADPQLRALALEKLTQERFNAEVAATLATLAPRTRRAESVRAIVALELLFDYLDGRTELPCADPLGDGQRLFASLIDSVGPQADGEAQTPFTASEPPADWGYLSSLSTYTRRSLFALPAATAVAAQARTAALRCAQAQTRLHAAPMLGEEQLRDWAHEHAQGSGLEWREYAAGAASSVLAMHALIAAAADPATSEADAQRLDHAYLATGGVITILDSLVDAPEDDAQGEAGFIRFYEPGELAVRVQALTREALARAREAPHGDHHAMTLAGVAAYYTTHPGARAPHARATVQIVRRELSPTIWPALAVMGGWRAAKRARALVSGGLE